MRTHCNDQEREAHKILDMARAGAVVSSEKINAALWITGDAVGLIQFKEVDMALLHITEPRCAGRSTNIKADICPHRDSCSRHTQLEVDRTLGIDKACKLQVMNLPYVKGHRCQYRIQS